MTTAELPRVFVIYERPYFGDGWVEFDVMETFGPGMGRIVGRERKRVFNAFILTHSALSAAPLAPNSPEVIEQTRRSYWWHRACKGPGEHMRDCACRVQDLVEKEWP